MEEWNSTPHVAQKLVARSRTPESLSNYNRPYGFDNGAVAAQGRTSPASGRHGYASDARGTSEPARKSHYPCRSTGFVSVRGLPRFPDAFKTLTEDLQTPEDYELITYR